MRYSDKSEFEKYKTLIATDNKEQPHDLFCKTNVKTGSNTKISTGLRP